MDAKLRETLKILVTNVKTFMSGNYLAKNTTRTSDLINDGEGGSPVDKFATESAIVQSDWEEGDSSNNGFIKNRTHYKTIYDIFTTFNSLTMISDGSRASASVTLPSLPEGMSWSNEKNWLITFIMGGEEYEYKSYDFDAGSGYAALYFGLESEMGTKPIVVLDLRNSKLSLANYTEDVTITDVKIIYLTGVKQLPDYYIPISIARTNDVPNNNNFINTIKTNGSFGVRMKSAVNEDANYMLGNDAMAIGMHTAAAGDNQFVFGKWNIIDTNNTYIEIVGNGTNTSSLSNARTLDWSGNETLKGNLTIGGASGNGTSVLTGANSLTITNTGAYNTVQHLDIISKYKSVLNILAGNGIGSGSTININANDTNTSNPTATSTSDSIINLVAQYVNILNQNNSTSGSQGLFINNYGYLATSGNTFQISTKNDVQSANNLTVVAPHGTSVQGYLNLYAEGYNDYKGTVTIRGGDNQSAGQVNIEAWAGQNSAGWIMLNGHGSSSSGSLIEINSGASTSGGGGTLNLTTYGCDDAAATSGGGQMNITSKGSNYASGGTLNIKAEGSGNSSVEGSGGSIYIEAGSSANNGRGYISIKSKASSVGEYRPGGYVSIVAENGVDATTYPGVVDINAEQVTMKHFLNIGGGASGNGIITANNTLLIGKTSGRCDVTLATSTGNMGSVGIINICPSYNGSNPLSPAGNGVLNLVSYNINFLGETINQTKWNNIGTIGAGQFSDALLQELENIGSNSVKNTFVIRAATDYNASSPSNPKMFLIADGYRNDDYSWGEGGHIHICAQGCDIADSTVSPNYSRVNIVAKVSKNDYAPGIIDIKSEGGSSQGGRVNIDATTNPNYTNQYGIISLTADEIHLNGAVKQLKKVISTSSCTPDTYYCPTSAIVSLVCNDNGFTGDYNYTFSGCFTAAAGMTQMPTQTNDQTITMTWYGDIGIEAGERYMFCSTKVSATEYVGVVTKLV